MSCCEDKKVWKCGFQRLSHYLF